MVASELVRTDLCQEILAGSFDELLDVLRVHFLILFMGGSCFHVRYFRERLAPGLWRPGGLGVTGVWSLMTLCNRLASVY